MDWLATELLTGFQKLLCLGLDRTPATDLLDGTVLTWHEAIATGRKWDQGRDTPRIRAAFVVLANTRESWPAPRHFLDALPRIEQAALGYEVKPADPARAMAAIEEARAMLNAERPREPEAAKEPRVSPEEKVAIEHQLRQHYLRDGKALAAGDGE